MIPLLPCSDCHRHVRMSDASCPFCGGTVREHRDVVQSAPPLARLGRAALMAFGAAATITLTSCGGGQVAAYGAPPDSTGIDDPEPTTEPDAGHDASTGDLDAGTQTIDEDPVAPAYGGPPAM